MDKPFFPVNKLLLRRLETPEDFAALPPAAPGLPAFDPATFVAHGADEHWCALGDDNAGQATAVVARLSLWHRHVPALTGEKKLGVIGHYAAAVATDADGSGDAARRLLAHACERLAAAGCTRAVGPMDGNTWRRYRFVVARGAGEGEEPPFFLEPDHQPPAWVAHWTDVGFTPLATYHSTRHDDFFSADRARVNAATARLARDHGVRLRALDPAPARFEDELRRLYAVAAVAFRPNFLYTPIGEAEFLAQYGPLRPHLRPELILLAEKEIAGHQNPVGFVFALPDRAQAARGETVDTVIVKTVAVRSEFARLGLGGALVGGAHAAAQALGLRRAIHALMHETNVSRRVSARFDTRPLRRYALFSRSLA